MTERVRKNDVAACVRQLSSCVVAFLTFGDVGLGFVGDAQLLAGSLRRSDEVQVVGGVLVMQADEADLDLALGFATGARSASAAVVRQHRHITSASSRDANFFMVKSSSIRWVKTV